MKAELLENWTYFWNRVLGAQYLIEQRITEVLADSSIVIPQRYKPKAGTGSSSKSEKNNLELVDVQTEDYCSVLVKFENGVRGVFTVSQVSAGNKNALEIHLDGSLSSGSWKQEEPSILHASGGWVKVEQVL